MEGGDGGRGNDQALQHHAGEKCPRQNPLAAGPGLFPHDRVGVRLQAQGNGGQGICQQVDKQQMHRRKGTGSPISEAYSTVKMPAALPESRNWMARLMLA